MSLPGQNHTPSSPSTSNYLREFASVSGATWWLEAKRKKKGSVSKRRRVLALPSVLALIPRAIAKVIYDRSAYQKDGWRITFDRGVQCKNEILAGYYEGFALPVVVVEVKGKPPKWVLKALGSPDKKFSKSRWSTERD